jgi:CHAD domain-containing protein
MAKSKKWKIKGLEERTSLEDSGRIVLKQRLKALISSIKLFLKEETVENLHEIRISLRRLRYNMEIFFCCFDKKKFVVFYKKISLLQDLTGNKRDFDVLIENINSINVNEEVEAINLLTKKIEEKKSTLQEKLILELVEFIHSRELKDFTKLIS